MTHRLPLQLTGRTAKSPAPIRPIPQILLSPLHARGGLMTHLASEKPTRRGARTSGSTHLILVILLSALAAVPLLKPGYFWSAHDARHDVYFIFQYLRVMNDGHWLARWSPEFSFGYGYPFFLIYGPLTSFLGALLVKFVGLGYTQAVELLFGAAIIASGLAMYGYVRSWLGRNAGLVAAVAYVFIPYRLVEVYVRASLAEYVALIWLPLILWSVRAAFQSTRPPTLPLPLHPPLLAPPLSTLHPPPSTLLALLATALTFAGLMLTSNLVALIFVPLLALYCLLLLLNRVNEEQPLRRLSKELLLPLIANLIRIGAAPAAGLFLGLLMSAFFWLPALSEGGWSIRINGTAATTGRSCISSTRTSCLRPTGALASANPDRTTRSRVRLSFQIGAAPLALAILSLIGLRGLRSGRRRELMLLWLWLLLAVFLMLPISGWAWQHIGFVSFAQFPWRWLMIAALPLAVLAGSAALLQGRSFVGR